VTAHGRMVMEGALLGGPELFLVSSPSLIVQNDGQRSVQLLADTHQGTHTLLPGDSIELELSDAQRPCRICFYDGGVQVTAGARPGDGHAARRG